MNRTDFVAFAVTTVRENLASEDRKYWISCSDDSSPAATVSFATTCVREVKRLDAYCVDCGAPKIPGLSMKLIKSDGLRKLVEHLHG